MNLLLYIAIGYLLYTSIILFRNSFEFKALKASKSSPKSTKKVSICIPARNEAHVIERCVASVFEQDYTNLEILVLDDESTDGTFEILESLSEKPQKLTVLKGSKKPDNWLGKPWACHQLSNCATGDMSIYIDADVWLERDAISKAVSELQNFDAITVWPEQKLVSFWEKQVIPLIYFSLFTLLPAKYVERSPRWLPPFLRKKLDPKFVAACGQFIAFNTLAYQKIGGHQSVKQEIIEDVALAKKIKSEGLTLKMLHGVGSVNCRMYTSDSEIWNGLRKNFFEGFNKNLFFFGLMAVLHIVLFILPLLTFVYAMFTNSSSLIIISAIPILITFLQRVVLNYMMKWELYSAFTHVLGVLWFQALGVQCVLDYFLKTKVTWKDRSVVP